MAGQVHPLSYHIPPSKLSSPPYHYPAIATQSALPSSSTKMNTSLDSGFFQETFIMKYSPKVSRRASTSSVTDDDVMDVELSSQNLHVPSSSSPSFLPCTPLSRISPNEFLTSVFHFKLRGPSRT